MTTTAASRIQTRRAQATSPTRVNMCRQALGARPPGRSPSGGRRQLPLRTTESAAAAGPRVAPRRTDGVAAGTRTDGGAVAALLQSVGLQMYATKLAKSGFDSLETLASMEDVDMQDMGVTSRHAEILRREIARLRGSLGEADIGNPVAVFLRDAGLEQYIEALIGQGFDDMESLVLVGDADLRECGLLRGHAVKLKKRLRDYEFGAGAEPQVIARAQPELGAGAKPEAALGWAPQPVSRSAPPVGGSVFSPLGLSGVERSWQQVQAVGAAVVGGRLYRHVFDIAPAAMDLFPPEVRRKYRNWTLDEDESTDILGSAALQNLFSKIINAVGSTVAGLRDMSKLVPMLQRLGARHIHYGVSEDHWPILGKALDMTLHDFLGEEYTAEVQANWTMVYSFVSAVMRDGFRQAASERARSLADTADKAECSTRVPSEGETDLSSRSD